MTLRDLERAVYRRLNKNASVPNAETQARIREFLNTRHRMLLRMPGMDELRSDVLTVTSVAGQQVYAVPEQGVARIDRVWDPTNRMPLAQRTKSWLRNTDPVPPSGTPVAWIPASFTQVHTQPTAAAEVFAISTSANDTNEVYVEGRVTGGDRRRASVIMTGTTGVSLDTTITNWIQIDKFYLAEEAQGTVTLHTSSGAGTQLSYITIGDTYAKFWSFYLYPTPSAVVTYNVDVVLGVFDMRNPLDEPLLPLDFHDLLAVGARLDEYEHTDDDRRRLAEVEWDQGVKALKAFVQNPPEYRPRMLGWSRRRVSIGGWNQPDSWNPAGPIAP